MLQVFFALVALIAPSIHVAVSAKRRSGAAAVVGTYLIYFPFIYVGLNHGHELGRRQSACCRCRKVS